MELKAKNAVLKINGKVVGEVKEIKMTLGDNGTRFAKCTKCDRIWADDMLSPKGLCPDCDIWSVS